MAEQIELLVHLDYDPEAKVWYVAKSDIPGLSLEAATATALVERVMAAAPGLIELNECLLEERFGTARDEPQLDMQEMNAPVLHSRKAVRPIFDTPLELPISRKPCKR